MDLYREMYYMQEGVVGYHICIVINDNNKIKITKDEHPYVHEACTCMLQELLYR